MGLEYVIRRKKTAYYFQAIEMLWLISLELNWISILVNKRSLVKKQIPGKNILINFLIKCYITEVIDQKQIP